MNPHDVDYYAVLQVHPGAEHEVIEAAYRQLMRMYHPDVAGGDAAHAARLHERAKAINRAYSVLRDPLQRRIYDGMRGPSASRVPSPPTAAAAAHSPSPEAAWHAASRQVDPAAGAVELVLPRWWHVLSAPMVALSSAYFLLPGTYEWEAGGGREVLRASTIPPLGVVGWLAATGRLDGLIGSSMVAMIGIWATLGLVALLIMGNVLPRLILAGGSALLLASGVLTTTLSSAGVPTWLAWTGLSVLSLLLAARVYVFGVLPTIGICWLLSRIG
jgi:hypothetical protein